MRSYRLTVNYVCLVGELKVGEMNLSPSLVEEGHGAYAEGVARAEPCPLPIARG